MFRLCTAIPGALIVGFALREMYQDLFHPTASGSLSSFVARAMSRTLRRWQGMLPSVGPLSLVTVIASWAVLLAVGFALVYWGSFPQDFRVDTGKDPAAESGFWPVLYLSLQMVSNIGLGDLTPKSTWLRMVVTVQALLGIALITASVSWIVLLYPALSRLRTLARRTSILARAAENTGIDVVSPSAAHVLGELALELIRTRVDLIHFPIIYYFYSGTETSSLAQAIPRLLHMADAGSKAKDAERLRLDSAVLRIALNDLAEVLARDFLRMDAKDPEAVFRAYAADHVKPATAKNSD